MIPCIGDHYKGKSKTSTLVISQTAFKNILLFVSRGRESLLQKPDSESKFKFIKRTNNISF